MTNGKIPTWFAVKWLRRHKSHVVVCFDSSGRKIIGSSFFYDKSHRAYVGYSDWIDDRCDWTIVDRKDVPVPDSELSQCE